jgi:hypothetical protein
MSTTFSQSPASIASRKALEPLVLVRSPTMSTPASCRNGTASTATRRPARPAACAGRPAAADALDDLAQVLGRGAAAAADQADAVGADELLERVGELGGLQRVLGAGLAELGRPAFGMTDSGTVRACDR